MTLCVIHWMGAGGRGFAGTNMGGVNRQALAMTAVGGAAAVNRPTRG